MTEEDSVDQVVFRPIKRQKVYRNRAASEDTDNDSTGNLVQGLYPGHVRKSENLASHQSSLSKPIRTDTGSSAVALSNPKLHSDNSMSSRFVAPRHDEAIKDDKTLVAWTDAHLVSTPSAELKPTKLHPPASTAAFSLSTESSAHEKSKPAPKRPRRRPPRPQAPPDLAEVARNELIDSLLTTSTHTTFSVPESSRDSIHSDVRGRNPDLDTRFAEDFEASHRSAAAERRARAAQAAATAAIQGPKMGGSKNRR